MATENEKTKLGIGENVEGALAYLVGWVSGIVLLLLEKENKFVRFHAMQSIAVFVPLTVLSLVVGYIPFIGGFLTWVLSVGTLVLWVFLMVQAVQSKAYKLPYVGEFAEQQVG